ncbi:S8 family peptidase [Halomarina salina]|uniref:S8 family peptidase n=1 Tax=Halomarina salina TaxID=1872699 RepID=A0ABD5RKA0_9EURY|nr:S8 family peptidase [Halomarina salina]
MDRRRFLTGVGAAGSGLALGVGGWVTTSDVELVEVNVGYDEPAGLDAALGDAATVGREFGFDAVTLRLPKRLVEPLAARTDIRYVEANAEKRLFDTASVADLDAEQTLPSGVERIGAGVAHENGLTGAGAKVAVLDTGVASRHPDLRENLGEGKAFVESDHEVGDGEDDESGAADVAADLPAWQDTDGHGTHCAGIVGASDNEQGVRGVAPGASIHAIKVGSDSGGKSADIAAGLEYAADSGVHVANLSLGDEDPSDLIADACRYATEAGVLVVGAAGNVDVGEDNTVVRYPAAHESVLAVGALADEGELADFSLTGPEVELVAPGDDVLSTVPGDEYEEHSGTSMAAPHVAGAAALLMAEGCSSDEVRARLGETATDVGLDEDEQGQGVVDVAAALGIAT